MAQLTRRWVHSDQTTPPKAKLAGDDGRSAACLKLLRDSVTDGADKDSGLVGSKAGSPGWRPQRHATG